MIEREELEIHIGSGGEIKVDVKNVRGKGCESYVTLFENVIGRIKEIRKKPEYYEPGPKTRIDIRKK